MFERYTEKARRVIFFARYEANRHGSPEINPEHLLLGLVREQHDWFGLLTSDQVNELRSTLADQNSVDVPTNAVADLPLGYFSKRVLAYAAEEAERMQDRHAGTEHLLLGLIREKKFMSAQVLAGFQSLLRERVKRYLNIEIHESQHGNSAWLQECFLSPRRHP